MPDRYTIKAALQSWFRSPPANRCGIVSPAHLWSAYASRFGYSVIPSREGNVWLCNDLSASCIREAAAERCSLAERGRVSLSLFLSLVLLQHSLSAVKIVVRRKRGGSDKQSGDEQEGLARVNHTLLHRRQKTLSTCCPSPLCFIILRNREAGAEWDIRDTFRFDFQSILFNSNSFFPKGKFIRLINYFELTNNFSWIILSRKEKMKNCIDEEERKRATSCLNHSSTLLSRKDINLPPWSAAVFRGKALSF